jgi:hypothetical protein
VGGRDVSLELPLGLNDALDQWTLLRVLHHTTVTA